MTLDDATRRLAEAGIDNPRAEARLLLAHALGISRDQTLTAQPTPDQANQFAALVKRRAANEPFAYITGHKEFWSLDFTVGPGVLIPRPDTETLIEEALRIFFEVRDVPGLKKKPSTSELLDWLKLLLNEDITVETLRDRRNNIETPEMGDRDAIGGMQHCAFAVTPSQPEAGSFGAGRGVTRRPKVSRRSRSGRSTGAGRNRTPFRRGRTPTRRPAAACRARGRCAPYPRGCAWATAAR